MQFQVPQFIETEDKIIGPLTIRQFIYVAIAAGISLVLYLTVKTWLWFVLSLPVVGLGVTLAFFKINGRPVHKVLLAGGEFLWRPQTYVWQPEHPSAPKNAPAMREAARGISLEDILAGKALKSAWRSIQSGTAPRKKTPEHLGSERYLISRHLTGDRRAAHRVDYR